MRDFWNQTQAHPFTKTLSMFCVEGIPVVLFDVGTRDGAIWLENIHSTQEGHGYGSQALDWFCALADKHGVEIRGEIYPPQGSTLGVEELAAWYQRHGFTVDGHKICREPRIAPEKVDQ